MEVGCFLRLGVSAVAWKNGCETNRITVEGTALPGRLIRNETGCRGREKPDELRLKPSRINGHGMPTTINTHRRNEPNSR